MDKISVLLLAENDWTAGYKLPEQVAVTHEIADLEDEKVRAYDVVILDRKVAPEEVAFLLRVTKAYTLFVTESVAIKGDTRYYFKCRKGQVYNADQWKDFLEKEIIYYFPRPYGEKFKLDQMAIAESFEGQVSYTGKCQAAVLGYYGAEFRQVTYWRNQVPIFKGQIIEFWLEYQCGKEVEIELQITQTRRGTIDDVVKVWTFSQKELDGLVCVDSPDCDTNIFISILAKGKGLLQIIGLHNRYSRGSHGAFLPGGIRRVCSNREEIFFYFDPGDMKPPLNVYFAGYKTVEGFEAYNIMRSMGAPFLLISESRLEGGNFYMGTPEYEELVRSQIQSCIDELGFYHSQVIFAGLSMGTYGALYYGCDFAPHALLLGKPLASIGSIAQAATYHRPDDFATALDMLLYHGGDTTAEAIEQVNERFWKKFGNTNWSSTSIVAAYMIEDDYDRNAYNTLLDRVNSSGVEIYGKGLHGRHNDDTNGIVRWFLRQYHSILRDSFNREI